MSLDTSVDPVSLGLPLKIPITHHRRYSYCDARTAHFTGIEDGKAMYEGECNCGHIYKEEIELNEAQVAMLKTVSIVNGQIQYGVGANEYKAEPLEEF